MNIYFLLEGRHTEKKIYSSWLKYLIPQLKRVEYHDEVEHNNYYIISGQGYPRILEEPLDNAVDKIQEVGNYNYLVLCVDVDEDSVTERLDYINKKIQEKELNLGNTKLIIVLQNRCIETWLLGNKQFFDSRESEQENLSVYINYYDVCQNDPELMGSYDMRNHVAFHYEYLKAIFTANNKVYTKKLPRYAQEKDYLDGLLERIKDQPEHLKTFQNFIEFCTMIKNIVGS